MDNKHGNPEQEEAEDNYSFDNQIPEFGLGPAPPSAEKDIFHLVNEGKKEPFPENPSHTSVRYPYGSQTGSITRPRNTVPSRMARPPRDLSASCIPFVGKLQLTTTTTRVYGDVVSDKAHQVRSRFDKPVTLGTNSSLPSFREEFMDVQKSKREQQKEKYKQLLNQRYQEDLQQLESRYQMKLDGVERMRSRIEQEKLSRELEYKNRFENITRTVDGAGLTHNHPVGQLTKVWAALAQALAAGGGAATR
eukprot:CAMPEP_0170171796 /NCGR_PEP_ID=MMETSP0040_2-20121228/4981_1 /TAXON_ID=641309 /ORGANISM="Lotharella oceanica, Strain CCMP622" /LENGTH=248 /DNA_ID=CAMNT_0010412077 /DNA_START=145 /DNA_END=892 /DNA_ORIENTATION=+